jgi:hypothetical protein
MLSKDYIKSNYKIKLRKIACKRDLESVPCQNCLRSTNHNVPQMYGGVATELHAFLSTTLRGAWWHVVAQLFEALRYKSEGRGFDSRLCHWNFLLT